MIFCIFHFLVFEALQPTLGSLQVVYAVANEGSRLEIPEGPLGRLISGLLHLQ